MSDNATVYAPNTGIIVQMPKQELANLCRKHGAELDTITTDDGTGKPLDGARLLWAMAGRESSFGQNMTPRHELAYDLGGIYAKNPQQAAGLQKYGRIFACSYGPLQIMACNAPRYTPSELAEDAEMALIAAADRLENYVIAHQGAKTLADIGQCWNGGHKGATTTPGYVEDITKYYAAGLSAMVATA
jgi:hypothetical protein